MGTNEYNKMKDRINSIIRNNGRTKAIQMLIDEDLCVSKSEAKRLYYQKKGIV